MNRALGVVAIRRRCFKILTELETVLMPELVCHGRTKSSAESRDQRRPGNPCLCRALSEGSRRRRTSDRQKSVCETSKIHIGVLGERVGHSNRVPRPVVGSAWLNRLARHWSPLVVETCWRRRRPGVESRAHVVPGSGGPDARGSGRGFARADRQSLSSAICRPCQWTREGNPLQRLHHPEPGDSATEPPAGAAIASDEGAGDGR